MPQHWPVFEADYLDTGMEKPLNMFIGRDAIHAWAKHLKLKVDSIFDDNEPFVELTQPITSSEGKEINDFASLWQSVCILSK